MNAYARLTKQNRRLVSRAIAEINLTQVAIAWGDLTAMLEDPQSLATSPCTLMGKFRNLQRQLHLVDQSAGTIITNALRTQENGSAIYRRLVEIVATPPSGQPRLQTAAEYDRGLKDMADRLEE